MKQGLKIGIFLRLMTADVNKSGTQTPAKSLIMVSEGYQALNPMDKKGGNRALIFEIPVFSSSKSELLKEILGKLEGRPALSSKGARLQPVLIFTPNPEILLAAKEDKNFKEILQHSDYNIPDGTGVLLASYWLKLKGITGTISERITGTDLMLDLISEAAVRGWRVFLLGGQPGIAQTAAANLKATFPGLTIKAASGPADIATASTKEIEGLVKEINSFGADLLFVGLGHGKQEKFLVENAPRLKIRLGMGVGGALDFAAGKLARAPRILQRLGLEWAYRLWQEPARWPRIYSATIRFPWEVIRS